MAFLARGSMGGAAAASIAAATWFAAAARGTGQPLAVLGAVLLAGVAGAALRRTARVLPPGKDVVVLTAVTVGGFFVLYLAGWTDRAHYDEVAHLLPWGVVVLSALWPEPNVLRYCLLLAGGALLGAAYTGDAEPVRWAVGGSLVSMAVALVATNRLTAASGPRLGGPATTGRRRVAAEAAAVLAVVGLLAALAASLVPPPPGQGGGDGDGFGDRELLRPPAGAVDFGERLDVGAGRGRRGDEVVFTIEAPAPDVWRATTYDHWDGERWERSPEARVEVDGLLRPGVGDVDAGREAPHFPQWVTVQARSASILVAAARPTYVGGPVVVRQGADGSIYPELPLARGQTYVATSERSHPGAEALRAATGPVPAEVAERYLQLPQVPQRVRALAADIAGRRTTAYDKARALEDWLYDNTTVTDDAEPAPLEAFLLDDRSGPPERTATAMAVMLRALGVPTRVAVGFLPGTPTGPGGDFVVRLSDTHAWVEVWFPGIGWQRFDPTGRAPSAPEDESVWDRLWRFVRALWPLAVAVVLGAAACLGWRALRWWRRQRSLPWAVRFLARLERAGAARGRPRQPQETPAEYAGELSRTVLPDPGLEQVGELVTVAAYSRHEPRAEERARAEEVLRAAAKAAPVVRLRAVHRWRTQARPTIRKP